MTELSPAAQRIWNAFLDRYEWEVTTKELFAVAAALRALADTKATEVSVEGHYRMIVDVDDIHAIADELEAQ